MVQPSKLVVWSLRRIGRPNVQGGASRVGARCSFQLCLFQGAAATYSRSLSLGIRFQAAEDEPLPMLSHYYGRPSSTESMYDSLSYAMTDRGFLTRVSLGAGSQYVPGGSSGITGKGRLDRPEEFLEETPYLPPRLPSYPEPEQPRPPKLMIDAATITDNALDEWSAWLRAARQGRSLREWGILASDLVTAIQYLSEAHPEVPSVTKGGRWSNAGRAGRRKQQQQEYPSVLGMLTYLKEGLRCVDSFNKAPTGSPSECLCSRRGRILEVHNSFHGCSCTKASRQEACEKFKPSRR